MALELIFLMIYDNCIIKYSVVDQKKSKFKEIVF